jgi:hypothetical protein
MQKNDQNVGKGSLSSHAPDLAHFSNAIVLSTEWQLVAMATYFHLSLLPHK